MFLIDRRMDFEEESRLSTTYYVFNLILFLGIQYLYISMLNTFIAGQLYFIEFRRIYSLLSFIGLLGLAGLEIYKGRRLGKSPVIVGFGLVFLVLSRFSEQLYLFFPLVLSLALVKVMADVIYPNIKLNFLINKLRFNIRGYEGLRIKGPYNKYFYPGDFFASQLVNMVFSFFSSGYAQQAKNKKIILSTKNDSDEFNMEKIVEVFMAQEEDRDNKFISINNVARSFFDRYEESDVFKLEEIIEIADDDFFRTYLETVLLSYPKLDFNYKLYLIDLDIIDVFYDFHLYPINKDYTEDLVVEKDFKARLVVEDREEKVDRLLHSLVEKDMIYNEIVEFFDKETSKERYELSRTDNFYLDYDEGRQLFTVYSHDIGRIGYLDKETMEPIRAINQPLDKNLVFSYEGRNQEGLQKYILTSRRDQEMERDPYELLMDIDIEVDFSRIEELKRPELNLISNFKIKLNK